MSVKPDWDLFEEKVLSVIDFFGGSVSPSTMKTCLLEMGFHETDTGRAVCLCLDRGTVTLGNKMHLVRKKNEETRLPV